MTSLKERIRRMIAANGPLSVSEYMATCLFDPQAGYYTTAEPFGASGDFVTAPEISQMFGELVGIWAYAAWRVLGAVPEPLLVEIGPGRGTLAADMVRVHRRLDPAFSGAARLALVEASDRLSRIQREKLERIDAAATWYRDLTSLPAGQAIFVANELFDALPVRQFVRTAAGWRERIVGLDDKGELALLAGPAGIDAALLPPGADEAPEGTIFEVAPAREALMDTIAAHIAQQGGAALFIDYGHLTSGLGDTLQAMRGHRYADALAEPGKADITSHVDFDALSRVARGHGLVVRLLTQGEFLLAMGLLERAGALGAAANETVRARITGEVQRLAGPDAMGELFKVMIVGPAGTTLPPEHTDTAG